MSSVQNQEQIISILTYSLPGSLVVDGCEVWRAAEGCSTMTEQAFVIGPVKTTGPHVPAARSHL